MGLNHRPESSLPILDHLDDGNAIRAFEKIKARSKYLVSTLPSAFEYLKHVREEELALMSEAS
jgi:tryptophan halogenase